MVGIARSAGALGRIAGERFVARQPQSKRRPQLFQRLYPYLPAMQGQSSSYRQAFFSSGLETEDGEDVSARTAKEIIKNLIDEEDKRGPLSDQRIAELLHGRGLRIARRTVGKYREQLSILPARFRRRVA